jgi:hypothetical protein
LYNLSDAGSVTYKKKTGYILMEFQTKLVLSQFIAGGKSEALSASVSK